MDYYTRTPPFCQHLFLSFSLPIIYTIFSHTSYYLFSKKSEVFFFSLEHCFILPFLSNSCYNSLRHLRKETSS